MAAYDATFYDTIRGGIQQSAQALVPLLFEELGLVAGDTVVDVGCGEGWWAQTFADHGLEAWGIDGDWHGDHLLGDRFLPVDLRNQMILFERADLVISLEVAEHLPPARAASFISELCAIAPVVVFSAAIPGQGGTGHLNEQWPAYWAELFAAESFEVSGALRFAIWNDDRIENWYRQNLLVAVHQDHVHEFTDLFATPVSEPFPMVHPVLYDARRKR